MQDPGGPQIQDDDICYLCDTQTPSDESPFPRVASCSLCRAGARGGDRFRRPDRPTRFVFLFGVRNARPWRRSGGCRRGPRRRYNVNGPRAYRGPVRPRPEAAPGRSPSSQSASCQVSQLFLADAVHPRAHSPPHRLRGRGVAGFRRLRPAPGSGTILVQEYSLPPVDYSIFAISVRP